MAVAIALLLFLSLRNLAAVVIAASEVLVVMVWTLGAMGFLGVPITLVTTVMPVILLAMTVADEVHLLERLQVDLDAGVGRAAFSREDVCRSIERNLVHMHRPIVLSSLTIAIGFLSFPAGTLEPLRQFGLYSGLGLVVALFMSFTLIPALAATLPPAFFRRVRLPRRREEEPAPPLEACLAGYESVSFWLCCAFIAVSLVGALRLTVQDSWVDNFDPRAPLVSSERDYNRSVALDDFVRREVPRALAGSGVQHHFSGDIPLSVSIIRAIVDNQLSSISWTLIGVAAIILVAYRSLWVALLVTAPVTAAAVMVFGGMGYAGVPLGIASSMFAALSVGAGVDFALHWWHVYERERDAGRAHQPAVRTALQVSGPAIRWNALVLSLSFLILSLSALKPNHILGWLLAAALAAAYAATMLLMPRLVRGLRRGV